MPETGDTGGVRHTSAPPAPEAAPAGHVPLPLDRLDQRTAHELMTPGVITIEEDASLREGLRAMVAHRKHAVLVVGYQTGVPLGWITDRGLLGHLAEENELAPVRNAISEAPESVPPGTTARQALARLSAAGTTHLLVSPAAGHTPQGVISAFDLIAAVAD